MDIVSQLNDIFFCRQNNIFFRQKNIRTKDETTVVD